jgi:hypothetical protein
VRRWADQSVRHCTLTLCKDTRDGAPCSYLILPPDTHGRSPGCVHTVPHSSRSKYVHSELCTADLRTACLCGTVGLCLKRRENRAMLPIWHHIYPQKGINSLRSKIKVGIREQLDHNPDRHWLFHYRGSCSYPEISGQQTNTVVDIPYSASAELCQPSAVDLGRAASGTYSICCFAAPISFIRGYTSK